MMRGLLALVTVGLMALGTALQPAQAQDQVPRNYGIHDGVERAEPDRSDARRAREDAAAAAAQSRCDAGDRAGCAALGRAYLYGEGKPQNRPVAELLLRESCEAGEAQGCLGLGELLSPIPEDGPREAGAAAFRRGCQLGLLEACEREAETLEYGLWDEDAQVEAAAALRRATCARGGTAACRSLADQKFALDRTPEDQAEGRATLERLCRKGDGVSCDILIVRFKMSSDDTNPSLTPVWREMLDLGCRAGIASHCSDLGMAVFADGNGPPEQRSAALALFDRACELDKYQCRASAAIRAHPALSAGCEAGRPADCAALGELYSDGPSPLWSPAEAVERLASACEAGIVDPCSRAASLALYSLDSPDADTIAKVDRWSIIACEGGNAGECADHGDRLLDGAIIPQDRQRGYALLARACDDGHTGTCDRLEDLSAQDPDAPLPQADNRLLPPLTPDEEAELLRDQQAAHAAQMAAYRAQDCTTTTVTFRGTVYEDTICSLRPRVSRGFVAQIGQAPWQALVWRPATTRGGMTLKPADRVLCGGSVIRKGWVLTAAHCLNDAHMGNESIRTAGHTIRLGLTNALDDEGLTYPILETHRHPDFKRPTLAFDIALVRYDTKRGQRGSNVQAPARIRLDPVPMGQRKLEAIPRATVFGWGLTAFENGVIPNQLRGGRVKLRDRASCTNITRFTDTTHRDSVLCADEVQGAEGGQACSGDSGGPLVIYSDPDKVPTLIGVVSGGVDCGTKSLPSRYIRVAHPAVQAWLRQTLPPDKSR